MCAGGRRMRHICAIAQTHGNFSQISGPNPYDFRLYGANSLIGMSIAFFFTSQRRLRFVKLRQPPLAGIGDQPNANLVRALVRSSRGKFYDGLRLLFSDWIRSEDGMTNDTPIQSAEP